MKKRAFGKDLRALMYGFGDDLYPRPDTLDLVEECLMEELARTMDKVLQKTPKGGKYRTEDLLEVLRRDVRKHGRMEELLYMNEELIRVRKAFDTDE